MCSLKNYISTLDSDSKDRYLKKISQIDNLDPYELPNKEWSQDIDKFPGISFIDLASYLVLQKSAYSMEEFRAYKSLEAYNQFVSGWVRELKVKPVQGKDLTIILGRVMHSQRVRDTPLTCWIIAENSGTILSAHCNCMAGLGETCTHVGALLFAVECYVRRRESITVTQNKAYWIVPPTKEVSYVPASEIDFTSASTKKRKLNLLIDEGVKCPNQLGKTSDVNTPSEDEITNFYSRLSQTEGHPAILSLVDNFSDSYVPKVLDKEQYPAILTELYDEQCMGMEVEEMKKLCSEVQLSVSQEQADNVERDTRQQSKSKAWYCFRAGRVTASRLKDVCHTSASDPSKSLIKSLCYPETCKFTSAATTWGLDHESKAIKAYIKYASQRHTDFTFATSGFVINPEYPHMGASPDGLIGCSCCEGDGLIEVKCPYSARNGTVAEAAVKDKNFCSSSTNGLTSISLKTNHAYYYQVQAQMFTTNRDYCDFIVWTPHDMTIERIYPDQSFWNAALEKATTFFRTALLLELVGKHYTTPTVQAAPSKWCYCSGKDEGEMIFCEKSDCSIGWYHFDCLGMKSAPSGKWYCPSCTKVPVSPSRARLCRSE